MGAATYLRAKKLKAVFSLNASPRSVRHFLFVVEPASNKSEQQSSTMAMTLGQRTQSKTCRLQRKGTIEATALIDSKERTAFSSLSPRNSF